MIIKIKAAVARLYFLFGREREILICTTFERDSLSKNLILKYFDLKTEAILKYIEKKVIFIKRNFNVVWGMNDFIHYDSSLKKFDIKCYNTASLSIEGALRRFGNECGFL